MASTKKSSDSAMDFTPPKVENDWVNLEALIQNGPVNLVVIRTFEYESSYEGKTTPKWGLVLKHESGRDYIISFAQGVTNRDASVQKIQEILDSEDATSVRVGIDKPKRSYQITAPNDSYRDFADLEPGFNGIPSNDEDIPF